MKKGKLFVFSGPSGVGKGTVANYFINNECLNLKLSISMTTREKRENEVDGVDYFFVSKKYFKNQISNNKVLEYAYFFNNYYGTPKDWVEKELNHGNNVILEIETNGAMQVMEKKLDAIFIFLTPPTLEKLKERLLKRGTETIEKIELRLEKAIEEIKNSKKFDYIVKNSNVEIAAEEIISIIKKEIN